MRYFLTAFVVLTLGLVCFSSYDASAQTRQPNCCTFSTATASPTPFVAYILNGNQVYGTGGTADSVINHVVTSDSIDPNSATILAAVNSIFIMTGGSNAGYMRFNYVSTAPYPTTYPIAMATSGHNPPMSTPCPTGAITYCGTGAVAYWCPNNTNTGCPSIYYINGTCTINCVQDDHWTNWDQTLNIMMMANGGNWNGTTLSAYSGLTDNLNNSYCSQYANKGDNVSVSGLSVPGFYEMGDDISSALATGLPINHPMLIVAPIASVASGTAGVNISPLTTNSVGSCAGNATTQCFKFGDLLRLKASVPCTSDPTTIVVCTQLKTSGAYIGELGSQPGFHYGLDKNGVDQTDAALITWQQGLRATASWDIITRGTTHCP